MSLHPDAQMFVTAIAGCLGAFAILMFFRWWDFRHERRKDRRD